MVLDADLASAVSALRDSVTEPMHTVSPTRARRAYRRLTVGAWPPALVSEVRVAAVSIEAVDDGEPRRIPARLYQPNTLGPWPLIVFFHGGGWVIGDLDTHDNMVRTLCEYADSAIVAVHYRRAPEHRFPAAFDDAAAATRWCRDNSAELGGDGRFAVSGDSAGAGLAAAVAWWYRDGGLAIDQQLLICPLLDLIPRSKSRADLRTGYLLDEDTIAWFVRHYAGELKVGDLATDPRVSPAHHRAATGLAGAIVVTAEFDPLRDEGEEYAFSLAAQGVPVTAVRLNGMTHGFADFANVSPAAHEELRRCGQVFGRALRAGNKARGRADDKPALFASDDRQCS